MTLATTDVSATMTPKGLAVRLPSGAGCIYVDKDHSYWRLKADGDRGRRLTGVTTVTKVFDIRPDNLLTWAARTNGIGIAEIAAPQIDAIREGNGTAEDLAWLRSADSIWRRLEQQRLTFNDVRERKGTIGTNIHELVFEALARGREVPHLDKLTDEERGYAKAVMAFFLDHSPRAQYVEQIVVDEDLGVAGRLDFYGHLRGCGAPGCPCAGYGNRPGVIDAKTGNYSGSSDHVQVQGYRHLLRQCELGLAEWGALLKLRADGTYDLISAEGEPELFTAGVSLYRAEAALSRAAGKAREARAAARKAAS